MIILKRIIYCLLIACCAGSCTHLQAPVVRSEFIDSLINHYSPPSLATDNQKEMQFWRQRINPSLPGYVNESRYAGCLNIEFRLFGDIDSLKKADSILEKVNRDFNFREASVDIAMASHCVTEHCFTRADSFLQKAKLLGLRPYESNSTSFDVDFELGKYSDAQAELNALISTIDFGYYFRKSKMEHLKGQLDSSIQTMLTAAALTESNHYLRGVALANAADLFIHAGDLKKANDLYTECVLLNSADFHSMMGLGWIAMVHDHNDSLAKRIFQFVLAKNKLPDALFKMTQLAGAMSDSPAQLKYAREFEEKATGPGYGRMYNKYLLQLYTGILRDPGSAETITRDELNNRSTPQTYAWYAWALFSNHKAGLAYKVFQEHVSGRPLEGLELYWMGRLMDGLDKKYNAVQFFKAAYKNKFDLDPSMCQFIENRLEE
jgi:hypothetical protein